MSFATYGDLIANFSQVEIDRIADKNRPGNGINDEVVAARMVCINAALEQADIKVSAIIGDRIALVLNDPGLVTALKYPAMALARFYLYDDLATEQVNTLKKDAEATLKAIREGLEGIGRTAGNATSTIPTDTLLQFDSRTRWGGDAF